MNDVLAAGHTHRPTAYETSPSLCCVGSLLGILFNVRSNGVYDDDQCEWGEDPVWAVRWWLQDELNFSEAMIIPSHEKCHAFIPSPWPDHPSIEDLRDASWKARTHCHDVRGTIRSHSDLRALVMKNACIVPNAAQDGDLVVLLEGATLPAVLRPSRLSSLNQVSATLSLVGALISERLIQHDCFRRNHPRNTLSSKFRQYKVEPLVQDLPMSRYTII